MNPLLDTQDYNLDKRQTRNTHIGLLCTRENPLLDTRYYNLDKRQTRSIQIQIFGPETTRH